MSDPFDVQPPAWLTDITRRNAEHGQWGNIAGTALAGLFNAVSNDESFAEGVGDARAQQVNPLNRLQAAAVQSQLVGEAARAQTLFANLNEQKRERAAWLEAVPAITPWLTATPEQRDQLPPPDPKGSKDALKAIESTRLKDEQYFARKDANDIRRANSQIVRDRAKSLNTWNEALGAAPPDVVSAIDALPNQGYNLDANGNRLSPSREALSAFNTWSTANGTHPEKAFGYKPNAIEVNNSKQGSQEKNIRLRGELASDLEDQKHTNRLAELSEKNKEYYNRLAARFQDQKELVKLKAAVHGSGGMSAFVEKRVDSFAKRLLADNPSDFKIKEGPDAGKIDEKRLLDTTRTLLRQFYLENGGQPPADTAATTAANNDWVQPSGAADRPDSADPDKTPSGLNYSIEPLK